MDPGAKLTLISTVQRGRKDGDKDGEEGSGLVKGTGLGTRALLLPKPCGVRFRWPSAKVVTVGTKSENERFKRHPKMPHQDIRHLF